MMNYLVDLQMAQEKPKEIEIPSNGTSLDLLRAVYRNPSIPLQIRLRAAIAALPHEAPRLAVTALVNEQSFAEILDRRLKKMEAMKLVGAQPQTIDGVDARLPPRVRDQGFRRV
jgi:hypothetical protein